MGCNSMPVKHFGVVVDVKRCIPDGVYIRILEDSPKQHFPTLLHDQGGFQRPYYETQSGQPCWARTRAFLAWNAGGHARTLASAPWLAEMPVQAVTQFALVGLLHARMRDLSNSVHKPRLKGGFSLRRIQWLCLQLAGPQQVNQRLRAGEHVLHRLCAPHADDVVGVHAVRQQRKIERPPRRDHRQGPVTGTPCGADARCIAVKAKVRLRAGPPEQFKLLLVQSRAERRQRRGDARLRQGNGVDIALGEVQSPRQWTYLELRQRFARWTVAIERALH